MSLTSFTVTPNPLVHGQTATISVTGAAANATVTVEIDNGGEPPATDSVEIQTNDMGNGSTTWTVPGSGWNVAKFNTTGAEEVSRTIVYPPDGGP